MRGLKILSLCLCLCLFSFGSLFAADEFVETTGTSYSKGIRIYNFDITDDNADGYSEDISAFMRGGVFMFETIPVANADCLAVDNPHARCTGAGAGTCAEPTDNYDITIKNDRGLDIAGGVLANRDTANAENVAPWNGNAYGFTPLDNGTYTIEVTNQDVDDATIRLIVYTME